MNPNGLEILADAIMQHEGFHIGSRSWRNRNPGNLRASKLASGDDGSGYATFDSLATGYAALVSDLGHKLTGHTETGLGPDSTLSDLISIWAPKEDQNDPASYVQAVCQYFHQAGRHEVRPDTKLRDIWQPPEEEPIAIGNDVHTP